VDTTPVKKTGSYTERYVSNRKAITEDEKNNALMLAEAAASDASFKVVMRPSRVQEILSGKTIFLLQRYLVATSKPIASK